MKRYIVLAILVLFVIAGCGTNKTAEQENKESKNMASDKTRTAIIETNKGTIKIELYEGKAPITVKNFIELAESGFYDGLIFHRVEPNFVAQTGDPKGDGTGGSGKTIPLEIVQDLKHIKGAVGMARRFEPNSATSQFYITLAETPSHDGNYAVFGKVVEGMDVVEKIVIGDRMTKVTVQ